MRQKISLAWAVLSLAVKKFWQIDGTERAGAFAYFAFFSLFPLIVLIVTIASAFIDPAAAGKTVIAYVERFTPLSGQMQSFISDAISGVIRARGQASVFALAGLAWVSTQLFMTIVFTTNRAWSVELDKKWWHLPLKSLVLLVIMTGAVLASLALSVLLNMVLGWESLFIPLLVLFFCLLLFYKTAPLRATRFHEVWPAALVTTVLLWLGEVLFVLFLRYFAGLNAIYGAFDGIMALLLWIYLSGCIFIFGACLCAAQAEKLSPASGKMF